MIAKNDIEDLVRERLKLPDNAVITSASLKIDETEEIYITGDVEVRLPGPEVANVQADIEVPIIRQKRGRRKKERLQPVAQRHAVPGEGAKIKDSQIKGFKAVLHQRKSMKKLTDNQLEALKSLEGVRVSKMTPEQKQQVKDIFEESTPRQF